MMRKISTWMLAGMIALGTLLPAVSSADPDHNKNKDHKHKKHHEDRWDDNDRDWNRSGHDRDDDKDWKRRNLSNISRDWDDRHDRYYYNNRYYDRYDLSSRQRDLLRDLLSGRSHDRRYALDRDLHWRLSHQYDNLPPGIQKRLERGKGLPPGLRDKVIDLPSRYNDYLGIPDHHRYRVGILDRDAILYDRDSGLIVDILRNVLNF